MTKRPLLFLIYTVLGLVLLAGGWLVPAHLRAVDAGVVQRAGRNTPGLVEQGLALVNGQRLGAAQLLLQTAQAEKISGWEKLGLAVTNLAQQHPAWQVWGGGDSRSSRLFESDPSLPDTGWEAFTAFAVREQNRQVMLEYLSGSAQPAVQELLRSHALTNTVLFSPSQSASGQAFDTAVATIGFLIDGGYVTKSLSDNLLRLAATANGGGDPQPLEQALMDLLSLGQRFNWNQLVTFVSRIGDFATLHSLAEQVRAADSQLPALFSIVLLSGKPAAVADYLAQLNQAGLRDLTAGLRYGTGGVNELLQSKQRFYRSSLRQQVTAYDPFGAFSRIATDGAFRQPQLAMAVKWLFYLAGGFLLALALHFARPAVSSLERPLQVRGFHYVRELLFASGFLLVVILLSEPFLAQENQNEAVSFRLHLPMEGSVVPAGFTHAHPTFMNNLVLLTLLLFFVLQGLLYIACLVKLAEIRRQQVPPRVKLKLLENEDHLFDAGLYLGFVGTIVSLILVSMGLVKFSLMAAYSSTSFGIIFVVIFKIFHLRPARRKLLLETEAEAVEDARPSPVTPP
jgi:hypothetical protein